MKLEGLKKLVEMMDESEDEGEESKATNMNEYGDDVKCAMKILIEAEKIKEDAMLMMKVQKELRKQKKAISSIEDIKDRYVEVTIKSDPEDILDPESGDVKFKSKKVDGDTEEDDD